MSGTRNKPPLRVRSEPFELELRRPFRLARGTSETRTNLFVEIAVGPHVGLGEAAPIARYGQDWRSARRTVESAIGALERDPEALLRHPDAFRTALSVEAFREQPAARAAVEMALWDLAGQRAGRPVWSLLGVREGAVPADIPTTSFTLGIDDPETMAEKVVEGARFASLKVKLGGPNDRASLEAVRRVTDQPLRVDANEGWSRDEALEHLAWLADAGVEMVEQPLAADDLEGHRWLRKRSPIPLVADESVLSVDSVPGLADAFDLINVKLMKCGGLGPALELVHAAREHDLGVMLGCMIESSLAITAAAHLSPWVDAVDLDGALLVSNDPFEGARLEAGRIVPPDRPGLGVVRRAGADPVLA